MNPRFFRVVVKIPGMGKTNVIVDSLTGVQYAYFAIGYSGGPVVLLGQDGKPLLYSPNQYTDQSS